MKVLRFEIPEPLYWRLVALKGELRARSWGELMRILEEREAKAMDAKKDITAEGIKPRVWAGKGEGESFLKED